MAHPQDCSPQAAVGDVSGLRLRGVAGLAGAAGGTRAARAAVAVLGFRSGSRDADRVRPRPGGGGHAGAVRRGCPPGARHGRRAGLAGLPGHQRQQGDTPVCAARPRACTGRGVDRGEAGGDQPRDAASRPGHRHHGEGRARWPGVPRLEPEQPGQDDHRAVFPARSGAAVGRRAPHLGRTRRPRVAPIAVRRGARAPRGRTRPARRARPAAARVRRPDRVPAQARPVPHPRTRPRHRGIRTGQFLRHPGAPRPPPALRPEARARRGARVVGGAEESAGRSRPQQPRGAHRGPSARVPHLPRRDPQGGVRRRWHDDLGHRHLRHREMARRRGDRAPARRAGAGPVRADPHGRQPVARAPHEGPERAVGPADELPARPRAHARDTGR